MMTCWCSEGFAEVGFGVELCLLEWKCCAGQVRGAEVSEIAVNLVRGQLIGAV